MQTIEDKALKNKLEKERTARKAEFNRAVLTKVGKKSEPGAIATGFRSSPSSDHGAADGLVLSVGSRVITSFGNIGTIEKMDKEVAEVLVGGMRLREKLENLRIVTDEPKAETRPLGSVPSQHLNIDGRDADMELNLIGKTTAEAEYELDRFIDEAYLASLPRVRIIHGFGTGALKNYVHHFLKNHDLIERFAFASQEQGGNGATIAEMKL